MNITSLDHSRQENHDSIPAAMETNAKTSLASVYGQDGETRSLVYTILPGYQLGDVSRLIREYGCRSKICRQRRVTVCHTYKHGRKITTGSMFRFQLRLGVQGLQ